MRKKYLSALLFGALLFASAGTFTSCKDYDDDIDNLQSQISANASAIEALKKVVENGDYVTGVEKSATGLTITFKNAGAKTITLEDKVGSIVTVENGVLCIDGKATEIKVAEPTEPTEHPKGLIIIENGMWSVLQEDGTYKSTGIPVSGVTVAGSEADGYTLTVYDENGEAQVVKLPGAASAITSIVLGTTPANINGATNVVGNAALTTSNIGIAVETFNLTGLDNAADWKGTKALPAKGDVVVSSPTTLDIRLNPVSVDASSVKFYFTNTKNNDLQPLVFKATAESGDNPLSAANGRAANTGNGLWTLSMENVVVAKNTYGDANSGLCKSIDEAVAGNWLYAVNAGHATRSEYKFTAKRANAQVLNKVNLKQGSTQTADIDITTTTVFDERIPKTFKVGTPIQVLPTAKSAMYDMYLEADASDVRVYGLTFDQVNHTFTIGNNPDVSSIPAQFNLIVWTAANNGQILKKTVTVHIDTQIQAAYQYEPMTHQVNWDAGKKNYFGIDLATMKTALGSKLDTWLQNVDLTATKIKYAWSDDNKNTWNAMPAGLTARLVSELKTTDVITNETDNRNNANFIQINVVNTSVSGLSLDKTYYIKVTFQTSASTSASKTLNEIIVPVTFKAPKLADLFAVKSGYVVDNVINAYFYKDSNDASVTLAKYFDKSVADAVVTFADEKIEDTDKKGVNWFTINNTNPNTVTAGNEIKFGTETTNAAKLTLIDGHNNDGKAQNGYGKILKVVSKKATFENWKYTTEGDDTYTFQIRLMSPIYEGTIVPVSGSSIVINGNDLVAGAKITDQQIVGKDYNGNTYSVVSDDPDASSAAPAADWYLNPQIKAVTAAPDASNYIKSIEYTKAKKVDDVVTTGWFTVKGDAISNTVDVKMPVTVEDAWGYKKTVEVPVTIKKN